ncbi:DUF2508 family protein [Paenibacillus puerhi]|uniref:DUF2508 family protein n=1 Tax=Paenibacillus puerhi TaxID=2692622 RepID=UPI00135759F9|nr:DUF2508 family protein [Paenibacillus puerhi]
MNWKWWKSRKMDKQEEKGFDERVKLVREIARAHMEWEVAQRRFEYALDKDQIDYAVYALEAAEKRFEMLIKLAKDGQISLSEVSASRASEEEQG